MGPFMIHSNLTWCWTWCSNHKGWTVSKYISILFTKSAFEILTLYRQQFSFSTDEWMFVRNRKCFIAVQTWIFSLLIHANCSTTWATRPRPQLPHVLKGVLGSCNHLTTGYFVYKIDFYHKHVHITSSEIYETALNQCHRVSDEDTVGTHIDDKHPIVQWHLQVCICLTHWPLGDLNEILDRQFFKLISVNGGWGIFGEIASDECHWTLLTISPQWFR